MARFNDQALTRYCQMRLIRLLDEGAVSRHLELKYGVSKGYLTRVRAGSGGIAGINGERLAPAFGFESYDDLVRAAHEWWRTEGKAAHAIVDAPSTHPDPEVAKAVHAVSDLVEREVITATLAKYAAITGEPWSWWIARFSEAQDKHRQIATQVRLEKKVEGKKAAYRSKVRAAGRALQEDKAKSVPVAAESKPKARKKRKAS